MTFQNKFVLKKRPKVGKFLGIVPQILNRFAWFYRQTLSTHPGQSACAIRLGKNVV